jgi:hypothetical protein
VINWNFEEVVSPNPEPNPGPVPTPTPGPNLGPVPEPIEPDVLEVENLISEYESSIVDINEINNTEYELSLSPNSDSVWSLIKDFPVSFTNQTNDFVNGDFKLDCGSFGFVCKNTFDSKTANLIQIIIKFLEGIYEGIGSAITDIVDMIKSLKSIADNLSGIGSMISNLMNDPNAITNLFLDSIKELINSDILTKVKAVGRVIGEKLKDTII